MDEDLSQMTREQLIGEIKKLRQESERIATAAGTSFVGINSDESGFRLSRTSFGFLH